MIYGLCECYVWPYSSKWMVGDGGTCGRCGEDVEVLSDLIGPDEALAIYEERYGQMPEPIGKVPWWENI